MIRRLTLAVALALGTLSVSAYALGLGEITSHSGLNQKFNADIGLVAVDAENIDDLHVELASPQTFQNAGVERPYLLSLLKFKPMMLKNGKAVIHVSSEFPIREPFLDFLIQVDWPRGHLVREYTVLLNPPVTTRRHAPKIAPAKAETAVTAPRAAPSSMQRASGSNSAAMVAESKYGPVKPNETLWGISEKVRPPKVTLVQTMIALQHANPDAFIAGNINRLRKGWILRVPAAQKMLEISRAEARNSYRQQTEAWVASKESSARGGSAGSASRTGSGSGTASGAPVEKGELRIASARPEGKGQAGAGEENGQTTAAASTVQKQLLLERENVATSKMETQELRGKMADLQKRLQDMKRLVSLKDEQLAQLEAQIASTKAGKAALKGTQPGGAAVPMTGEPGVGAKPTESTAAMPMTGQPGVGAKPPELAGNSQPAGAMPMTGQPGNGTQAKASATGNSMPPAAAATAAAAAAKAKAEAKPKPPSAATPQAKPTPKPPVVKPTPPAPVPESFLLQYWHYLLAAGALVMLLLALLIARRKSAPEPVDRLAAGGASTDAGSSVDSLSSEMSETTDDLSDLDEATSGDTSFLSEFSPSDIKTLRDDTTEVDPISEADVYIAYGRYQQATELLEQALQREPDRLALKHKLLEVHYAMGNRDGFSALAKEIVDGGQDIVDAKGWTRVCEMGRELDPGNPMFKGGGDTGDAQGLDSLHLGDIHTETPSELMSEGKDLSALSSEMVDKTGEDGEELNPDDDLSAQDLGLDLDDLDEYSEPIEEVESLELELPDLDSEELISILDPAEAPGSAATGGAAPDHNDADESAFSPEELAAELEGLSELSMLGEEAAGHEEPTAAAGEQAPTDAPLQLDEAFGEDATGPDSTDADLDDLLLTPEPADEDAVENKLELAKAYLEMGDPDGARSILDEVKSEGSLAQQEAASKMLAELG